jgi:hypothetical protein
MIIGFTHTHAYPGAQANLHQAETLAAGPCTVEFGDGVMVPATLCRAGDGWKLAIDGYRTARGTAIPGKRWRLQAEGGLLKLGARIAG